MSQVSIIDIEGNHPQIPTQFDANVGFAIPIGNVLEILGEVVAAGTVPVQTVGSGNTITTQVQISQAIASTNSANVGLAAFNSADFSVDANGFVSILGSAATQSVDVDTSTPPGTDPVVPNGSGVITVTGGQVAAGSTANVIRTNSLAANSYTIQIQRSSAQAVSTLGANGVAHFNSSQFTVDGNGYVALTGGGQAIDSFTTDLSGPISPDGAGNVAFTGATNIFSDGSVANTMRLNVQGTNHALFVGRGANTASAQIPVGTNGQWLIGSTGADPAFSTPTSSDSSITFTLGAGTLSAQVTGGTTVGKTITGDTGGALSPTAGNWNIVGGAALSAGTNASVTSGSGSTLTVTSINTAKWIVDPTANRGTHQTIAGAISAASSGETIFIRPGTYTENLTLKAGVNLTAFECDSSLNGTGHVIISGTCTMTTAGTVTISGIQLQTNSAALLAVTGSAASIVILDNCYLNMGTSAITYSSSSASSAININSCSGNISTTGIAAFTHTSAGTLSISYSDITNTGLSVTAATASAGTLTIFSCYLEFAISNSSTNSYQERNSHTNTTAINLTGLTIAGTAGLGSNFMRNCYHSSGTATAISVSAGGTLVITGGGVSSTNTNAISGAGTLNYSSIAFSNSSLINTTTQFGGVAQGIQFQAPSAGFLGEQIRATVTQAAAITLTTLTSANVTSISLTAGIWDVSGVICYGNGATGNSFASAITSVSAGLGTAGDNGIGGTASPTALQDMSYTIPSFRFTLTATTTIYLVAFAAVVAGTMKAYGRISGTRVG